MPGAVVEIRQPVERQLLLPPPLSVVTLTKASMVALGATVTASPPLTVASMIDRLSVNVGLGTLSRSLADASTRYTATNQSGRLKVSRMSPPASATTVTLRFHVLPISSLTKR